MNKEEGKEEIKSVDDGNGGGIGVMEKRAETMEPGTEGLTDKMLGLLVKLSEYGYLTIEEIRFIYGNESHGYRVLKSLARQELVATFTTGLKPRRAYCLTARGYRLLEQFGRLRAGKRFQPADYKQFICGHRLACAKAGLILETHPLIQAYAPESVLWGKRERNDEKVCDAEFLYGEEGIRVGLEVELTLKNTERLAESFRDLGQRDLDQVWWLCGNENIREALIKAAQRRSWELTPRHFFGMMDELLERRLSLTLSDIDGTAFTIDPARADLPTAPRLEAPPPQPQAAEPERREIYSAPEIPPNAIAVRPPEVAKEEVHVIYLQELAWKGFWVAILTIMAFFLLRIPIMAFHDRWGWLFTSTYWMDDWVRRPVDRRNFSMGPLKFDLLSLERTRQWHRLRLRIRNESDSHCIVESLQIVGSSTDAMFRDQEVSEELTAAFPWTGNVVFFKPVTVDRMKLRLKIGGPGEVCRSVLIPIDFQ